MMEQLEVGDALDAIYGTLYKKAGQTGRRDGLLLYEDKQQIVDLWNRGYHDWQISNILDIKLYVVQDALIWQNIDYRTRRTKIECDLYNLAAINTLFNGAAYLRLQMFRQGLNKEELANRLSNLICRTRVYQICNGRYIPTSDELCYIAAITGINIEDWCLCSSDVKLQIKENKNLPHAAGEWATTADEFLSTYKKFVIRYAFAYARATKPGATRELMFTIDYSSNAMYDFEQCARNMRDEDAHKAVEILGLDDITDIYKVDVVNAGYVTRFKKYYNDMQKNIPAKYGLKTLICRTALDNLAQVERSLTYGIE